MRLFLLSCLLVALSFNAQAQEGIFVEAERFSDYGGWSLDHQFMDEMGSPYLIAHGSGVPVADARTTVSIPRAGNWTVYVRTYNWTSPWCSSDGPGRFSVAVGKKTLKQVLGATGTGWEWQMAGSLRLPAGETELSIKDLTGFDGRVDAVWLTDGGICPPSGGPELEAFRRKALALPEEPSQNLSFDLVVCGAGMAGMCAAVAAARQGLSVALVNDREKLGGNNSSDIRVHLGGHIELGPYPALGRMIREFAPPVHENAQPASFYQDGRKRAWIEAEPLVTLFVPYHIHKTETSDGHIDAVIARNVVSGEDIRLTAPLFVDCTGDGTVGFLAGAHWRYGREARSEYGESLAPETADDCVMGASVQWYSSPESQRVAFPLFEYGMVFNEESCQQLKKGTWEWETGMTWNMVSEFEQVRDYGLLAVYSNWSYLKNRSSRKAEYANDRLDWVAYMAGKRESRRLIGDYVLAQQDVEKEVYHEDASFAASWSIDLHRPDPENSRYFPGREFLAHSDQYPIRPYSVPYRCLYSRNIDNLFMAGRCISTTHVALGTIRVMRTTAMMGEVVGLAASICHGHGVLPREVYWNYLPELKELMRKGAVRGKDLPDNQHYNLSDFKQ